MMSVRRFDSKRRFVMACIVAGVALAMLALASQPTLVAQEADERWVGTWATAAVVRPTPPPPGQAGQATQVRRRRGRPLPTFNNQTLRLPTLRFRPVP